MAQGFLAFFSFEKACLRKRLRKQNARKQMAPTHKQMAAIHKQCRAMRG
jgi:hypothetical protein